MTDALIVQVAPPHGECYSLDLSEFALGGNENTVAKSTSWSGNYSGRPHFAREIYNLLFLTNPGESTATATRAAMRQFFRFLDDRATAGEVVERSIDVTDAHGPAFIQWLNGDEHNYGVAKTALNRMRTLAGGRLLFWPTRRRSLSVREEPIDDKTLKRFFHALRHEARFIEAMYDEGEHRAAMGSDPRGSDSAAWLPAENRLWLVKTLLKEGLPDSQTLRAMGAREAFESQLEGPSYLAPGAEERSSRGVSGLIRWLVPGFSEISVFFWLFLLGTGWNYSTACAVDATDPEGWAQPHPQSEGFAVIHAFKNRASRHQFAISMTKPKWHPFRVLQYVIARTLPLRNEIRRRLALLRAEHKAAAESDLQLMKQIERHERLLRTPWLFFSGKTEGRINGFLSDGTSVGLNRVGRAVIEAHGLAEKHPRLLSIVTSDARHTWIGHAYVQSGYQVLLTQLASQHASVRTLKHYLRSRRYREHSEAQVRKLQDALFEEIGEGRIVDPTRLRLLVEQGRITPEQERRLADIRQRTRLGMGCLNPKSPPRHVAPDHQQGKLCRVQRCTGCANGIVFPESLPLLARACAELLHLRRSMPVAAWDGSSFADEHESITETLKSFAADAVAAEIAAWTEKLNRGEIAAHGTYPSY